MAARGSAEHLTVLVEYSEGILARLHRQIEVRFDPPASWHLCSALKSVLCGGCSPETCSAKPLTCVMTCASSFPLVVGTLQLYKDGATRPPFLQAKEMDSIIKVTFNISVLSWPSTITARTLRQWPAPPPWHSRALCPLTIVVVGC